jgi:ArsR family transcriptional regulator
MTSAEQKIRALADGTRLRLLLLLRKREMCVCDLVDVLKSPQPTISRHLAHLRQAGLVTMRKQGFWTYYSLLPSRSAVHKQLLATLDACLKDEKEFAKDQKLAAELSRASRCTE